MKTSGKISRYTAAGIATVLLHTGILFMPVVLPLRNTGTSSAEIVRTPGFCVCRHHRPCTGSRGFRRFSGRTIDRFRHFSRFARSTPNHRFYSTPNDRCSHPANRCCPAKHCSCTPNHRNDPNDCCYPANNCC